MIRLFTASVLALSLLTACANMVPIKAVPSGSFELMLNKQSKPPILPEGVAVLHEYPACAFEVIGEAKVPHNRIEITPSRIKALRAQAAMHGADAIIVHPNQQTCSDGTPTPLCPGRGEYVIASAISYLDAPEPSAGHAGLEYDFKRGYDTIEFYNHQNH